MRNREVIEREMYRAREDLESSLAELKHTVQEKIDVRARARVAVAKGKQKAHEAFETGKEKAHVAFVRGKEVSRDLAERGRDGAADLYGKAKERPEIVGAIVGGVVAVGALIYTAGLVVDHRPPLLHLTVIVSLVANASRILSSALSAGSTTARTH
jgi:hypothetical protein